VTAWPYAGDSPVARARRVAQAYRARLEILDLDGCHDLDRLFADLGETWVAPRVLTVQPTDWLTAAEAADLAGVGVATLRQWRRRGLLSGERDARGSWRYWAGEVLDLVSSPRTRTRRRVHTGRSGP
jgi:hypothetical protein